MKKRRNEKMKRTLPLPHIHFIHILTNLPLHCDKEEKEPIQEQNGPEHRDIEELKEGEEESKEDGLLG